MKKAKDNTIQKAGSWAFIIGVILAIIAGFWPLSTVMTSVLIILGLIVGFLNVTGSETNSFLFATLVLVVMTSMGGTILASIEYIGPMLSSIFQAMVVFTIPAGVVVALKAIYSLAED